MKTLAFSFILLLITVVPVSAYTPAEYASESHAVPLYFQQDGTGGWFGELENGVMFYQVPIDAGQSFRMQKFTVGSTSFYVTDKGRIDAVSDLAAVSIYLTLA